MQVLTDMPKHLGLGSNWVIPNNDWLITVRALYVSHGERYASVKYLYFFLIQPSPGKKEVGQPYTTISSTSLGFSIWNSYGEQYHLKRN